MSFHFGSGGKEVAGKRDTKKTLERRLAYANSVTIVNEFDVPLLNTSGGPVNRM